MRNTIKYNTTTEANSLKKGNFNIGINEVDYGPTSETGYHNTITPPANGYTIYKNIGDNKRSIYVAQNDQELVTIKNNFGATGNTAEEILNWASQQDDILILNKPLDDIVTDGLVLYLDAGVTPSYPRTGTTWTDLSGSGNTGTLINGVSYEDGSLVFDGVDDYVNITDSNTLDGFSSVTFEAWVNPDDSASYRRIFDKNYNNSYNFSISNNNTFYIYINGSLSNANTTVNLDEWQLLTATYNGSSAVFYKNGTLVQTNAFAQGNVGTNSDDLRIGINYGSLTSEFNGHIGLCKIYNRALTASEVLQNYNATKDRYAFITTWETTSSGETITLPLISTGTYDFTVEWGDDTTDTITSYNQSEVTHTYSEAGTYTVKIRGRIDGFRFNNGGDKHKIRSIDNYGPLVITTNAAFYGCTGLTSSAIDSPGISTTDLTNTFRDCTNFNGYINNWDVSNVTNMVEMFAGASSFNQPLNNWDVSSVTTMFRMFQETPFNQDIGSWDVGNVGNMYAMFYLNNVFNNGGSPSINNWNVSGVTNMGFLFQSTKFNQPIGNWDVSNVTSFWYTFAGTPFNQDISNWDVSSVTNMANMFAGASSFNQPLNNWDVSSVTNMGAMFSYCPFNQEISGWDVSSVTSMDAMFFGGSFNQDITNWDVSSVTSMRRMFFINRSFNQPIGNWNVSGVTNMSLMFRDADAFDQDISNWDIDQVTNFTDFMIYAESFSTTNYDLLLVDWEAQAPQPNIIINFGTAKYTANSAAATARQSLIDNYNWTITDGGTI